MSAVENKTKLFQFSSAFSFSFIMYYVLLVTSFKDGAFKGLIEKRVYRQKSMGGADNPPPPFLRASFNIAASHEGPQLKTAAKILDFGNLWETSPIKIILVKAFSKIQSSLVCHSWVSNQYNID